MAKTYKTANGLKNALKKVIGEESKATNTGMMTKGWLMFPIEKPTMRVVMVGTEGLPEKFVPREDNPDLHEWAMDLVSTFGGRADSCIMFGRESIYVDIDLEVSK